MINQKYKDAYKEVLEIIKYLPQNELSRIPKEKIEYFQRNQNSNHTFNFDSSITLEEQNISREANAIILNLINDYFFNDEKKEKLAKILKINEDNYQEKQREKYDPNNLFRTRSNITQNYNDNISEETAIIEYTEKNFLQKLFDKIKHLFKKD